MNDQRTTTTITLTGPAGCGKTALMHAIGGLLDALGLKVELLEDDGCHEVPVPLVLDYTEDAFADDVIEPRKVTLKTKETT